MAQKVYSAVAHKREPLNTEEENRLRNACKTIKEKVIIFTLLDTGLRVAEFCGMQKENIDWQAHRIVIWGKGGAMYGKKSKRRVIPMSPVVQMLLEPWIASNEGIGLGKRAVQLIVRKIANRAGIVRKCSPHVLRHTFACNVLKKGMTLTTLKSLLGHDNLQTTFIYLNMSPENAIKEFQEKW